MKRKLIIILLITCAIKSFSQDSKLSIELNFPYPFDNNSVANNYNGIIDVGAKYKFINYKKLNAGVSLNISLLKSNSEFNSLFLDLKTTSYLFQPRLFAELNFGKFYPLLGIGYASMVFHSSDTDEDIIFIFRNGDRNEFSVNNTQSGIDLNAGFKYDLNENIFFQMQYDYIILSAELPIINSKYNTNVNLLKFGLGYRL